MEYRLGLSHKWNTEPTRMVISRLEAFDRYMSGENDIEVYDRASCSVGSLGRIQLCALRDSVNLDFMIKLHDEVKERASDD